MDYFSVARVIFAIGLIGCDNQVGMESELSKTEMSAESEVQESELPESEVVELELLESEVYSYTEMSLTMYETKGWST